MRYRQCILPRISGRSMSFGESLGTSAEFKVTSLFLSLFQQIFQIISCLFIFVFPLLVWFIDHMIEMVFPVYNAYICLLKHSPMSVLHDALSFFVSKLVTYLKYKLTLFLCPFKSFIVHSIKTIKKYLVIKNTSSKSVQHSTARSYLPLCLPRIQIINSITCHLKLHVGETSHSAQVEVDRSRKEGNVDSDSPWITYLKKAQLHDCF